MNADGQTTYITGLATAYDLYFSLFSGKDQTFAGDPKLGSGVYAEKNL